MTVTGFCVNEMKEFFNENKVATFEDLIKRSHFISNELSDYDLASTLELKAVYMAWKLYHFLKSHFAETFEIELLFSNNIDLVSGFKITCDGETVILLDIIEE